MNTASCQPITANAFDFIDGSLESGISPQSFVLPVSAGIRSKAELFGALARAGRFPSYFGENWDALLDCLLDFGWIRKRQIVITHSDVRLLHQPTDCRVYLHILRQARLGWSSAGKHSAGSVNEALPDHELLVQFDRNDRSSVVHRLKSQVSA